MLLIDRFFSALRYLGLCGCVLTAIQSYAGTNPILSITPITPLVTDIPNNGTTRTVIFNVVNNSNNPNQIHFTMNPLSGVDIITDTTGACTPTTTASSCLLYLVFHGNQTTPVITNAPVLTTGLSSTRPSFNQMLQMHTAPASDTVDMSFVQALIEQDPAPGDPSDLATYVAKIKILAPNLKEFDVRVTPLAFTPGAYQAYANTVTAIREAYPDTNLTIGFHPDLDKDSDSCVAWGCNVTSCNIDPRDWDMTQLTCMLNTSIETMNAITALLPPGKGFDRFTAEQSYVVPTEPCPLPTPLPSPPACIQQIKACLCPQGTLTANGSACPVSNAYTCPVGISLATPSVTYGNVLGGYGGPEVFGPTLYDVSFFQFYNLGKAIISEYDALITGGYFPASSTACHAQPFPTPLMVVDVDTPGAYAPEIPCPNTGQPDVANIYNNPSTANHSVSLAANYLAFLLTQYAPIQTVVNTSGAVVYHTLSGEPNILGPWTLAEISQLNYNMNINLLYLQKLYPDLFQNGIPSIPWAIWNFSQILNQITLP